MRYKCGIFTVTKIVIMENNTNTLEEVEIWKPVPGYEGLYAVSNKGNVKTFLNRNGKKHLKLRRNRFGYYRVALYKDKKVKSMGVHRVVALAFIGQPPQEDFVINHINGIKTDNRVENIEWCSSGDNTRHAIAMGLRPKINPHCVFRKRGEENVNSKKVSVYNMEGDLLNEYPSVSAAAKENKISRDSIWRCAKGEKAYHKGLVWVY